jgi:hypothetical protein
LHEQCSIKAKKWLSTKKSKGRRRSGTLKNISTKKSLSNLRTEFIHLNQFSIYPKKIAIMERKRNEGY